MTTSAFYVRQDERTFLPTDCTIGPWSRDAQHGGPPAALLGRAIEDEVGPDKQVTRVVFDILRPVPLERLEIETEVVRPGKKVTLVDATLSSEGKLIMRASGWAIRITDYELESSAGMGPPSRPEDHEPMEASKIVPPTTYLHATEWRFVEGSFLEPGPAKAWIRTKVPLVDGEDDSPLTKVLAVADSASGVSGALEFRKWLYINTDLSVYVHRKPIGEWILVDAVTTPEPTGTALTSGRLCDEAGPIGTSSQSLFVSPR